ncbi:unannotated protein [freshwater metagenome]|uniref:Unannotated protein n=1 Tax=freshwater metagenome TaxID=449393 RepID=A0A6J6F3J5_9ZZZZ
MLGRFVKNQDWRVGKKGARNHEALTFTATEVIAIRTDGGIKASRACIDKRQEARSSANVEQLSVGCISIAHKEVVSNGCVEEMIILHDDRDAWAWEALKLGGLKLIDRNSPALAWEQPD